MPAYRIATIAAIVALALMQARADKPKRCDAPAIWDMRRVIVQR